MYGGFTEIRDGAVLGSGIVMLPHAGDNTIGLIVAYIAITVGAAALTSHLVVRIVKRVRK